MTVPVLVAVAWPYASGSRHLGHLAGAYLPADVFARHQRLVGNEVLMVSGSDVHGTPITVRAEREGVSPTVIVDRYHREFVRQWDQLGFSWDLFTTTGTDNHAQVTQEMFLAQLANGHIDRRVSEQYYDPTACRFLPDRYIEGTCPHCAYGEARGDQCDNCGRTLDALELGAPRSKISGATPERRETEHFYFRYSDFTARLMQIYEDKPHWRPHVLNFVRGYLKEGLLDRAITRDIDWGIDLPVDDLGSNKRIYVWYDAVIGYLSASKEWSIQQGDEDAWRHWWENDQSRHVYFIGKDNIPFHCLFWPAQLMGAGELHLPDDVPANQYVTFKGGKASASRGVGLTIDEGLALFEPDGLRYALAANFPEQADTEVSIEAIARRINEELVANWGNLVNRVLSMLHKNHGAQPASTNRLEQDTALLRGVDETLLRCDQHLHRIELRAALREAMSGAQSINAYLNATEPWKLAKSDPQRSATVLGTALDAINGLRVCFAPYLPFSTARLDAILGPIDGWIRKEVPVGTDIEKPLPLFAKIDIDALTA